MQLRLQQKLRLVRLLYGQGYNREAIVELFRLMDWLLRLPDGLEARFEEQVAVIEEVEQIPLLSRLEERAIERGLQKGLQQGLQQSILQALEERFGAVPAAIMRKVEALEDAERLRWLIRQAIRVESLGSFEALLERTQPGE